MKYSLEQLRKITEIAEERGTFEAVARFLNLKTKSLYYFRKKDQYLEQAIQKGFDKHIPKNNCPYTKTELTQIEMIMRTGYKKDVAKYFNVCVKTIRNQSKIYPELRIALSKGRKARYYLQHDFVKYNLSHIEEVAEKTGRKILVAQFLNTDIGKLRRTEIINLELALVIRRGLDKYKSNQRAAKLANKQFISTANQKQSNSQELFKYIKPKRKLVADLRSIENIGEENALARYRKIKEEEREAMSRRELKNIGELI
jgi:ribosome modulation factor